MSNRVKKRFDQSITEEGGKYAATFDLDKNITGIYGLLFTSDREDLMYYRCTIKLYVNREEIFPENYEAKLLMCGINVAPNDRFYYMGSMPPGNGKVNVEYLDSPSTQAYFEAYRVTLYLDCEIADEL